MSFALFVAEEWGELTEVALIDLFLRYFLAFCLGDVGVVVFISLGANSCWGVLCLYDIGLGWLGWVALTGLGGWTRWRQLGWVVKPGGVFWAVSCS